MKWKPPSTNRNQNSSIIGNLLDINQTLISEKSILNWSMLWILSLVWPRLSCKTQVFWEKAAPSFISFSSRLKNKNMFTPHCIDCTDTVVQVHCSIYVLFKQHIYCTTRTKNEIIVAMELYQQCLNIHTSELSLQVGVQNTILYVVPSTCFSNSNNNLYF